MEIGVQTVGLDAIRLRYPLAKSEPFMGPTHHRLSWATTEGRVSNPVWITHAD